MEDNSKLFVFDKKEVVLIFIFIVIISAISFTLGLRLGKTIAIEKAGYTPEDTKELELKSNTEEQADELINQPTESTSTEATEPVDAKGEDASNLDRLKKEFEELEKNKFQGKDQQNNSVPNQAEPKVENVEEKQVSVSLDGKVTIQLGSFDNEQEAKDFADGFTVRGYEPIVNQVDIVGKGTWYRVSIGIFSNVQEAKDYIKKEKSLFQGQDYIIKEFKN